MGCCRKPAEDGGYATPAALLLSLALAVVSSALVVRSVQALRLARAEYAKTREAYALDGAQLSAAAAVVRSGGPGPYSWTFSTDLGWVRAVAEPEADKLRLAAFGGLDDGVLQTLGVADPDALKARVAAAALAADAPDLADLDAAPMWRACGPSVASWFGEQDRFSYAPRRAPVAGDQPAAWHIGEAWRIQIATPAGWRDDRIVRFTGDARRPVAVVARRLSKAAGGGEACEKLLSAAVGG